MSILMNLYYTGENGNARKFAEEMEASGIAQQIREEPGNERYEYFYPKDNEEVVLLVDMWKDQEALDVHHHSDMMQKISALRDKYQLELRAERYLSDNENIPEKDKKFIK